MTDYENMSIKKLNKLTYDYLRRNPPYGGTWEGDMSINDISRALIEAYRREKGACFLTNINLRDNERDDPDYRFTAFVGQTIYNFDYIILLPNDDEVLRQLIVEHNRTNKNPSDKNSYDLIQQIMERIEQVGGTTLLWA